MEIQKSEPEYRKVTMESKFFMLMHHLKVRNGVSQEKAEAFWKLLQDEFNAEYENLTPSWLSTPTRLACQEA